MRRRRLQSESRTERFVTGWRPRESLSADRLEQEYADVEELPDEVDRRLGEIETALAAFEERPVVYDPVDVARAGVFVSIERDGELRVERGYVRPEDEPPAEPVASTDSDTPSATTPTNCARLSEARTAPSVSWRRM